MSEDNEIQALFRWTPEAISRLKTLWLAWYKVSDIADIMGASKAAVLAQAYKRTFPYRDPHLFADKFRRVPSLEIWPPRTEISTTSKAPAKPVAVPPVLGYLSTFRVPKYFRLSPPRVLVTPDVIIPPTGELRPEGGRPSELWPPERMEELRRLRCEEGLSFDKIAKIFGYTKGSVIGKAQRLGFIGIAAPKAPTPIPVLGPPVRVAENPFRVVERPKKVVETPIAVVKPVEVAPRPPPKRIMVAEPKPEKPAKAAPQPRPRRLPSVPRRNKKEVFDHSQDAKMIEEFLRTKGATVVAPVYASATSTKLSVAEEAKLLEKVQTPEKRSREELSAARNRKFFGDKRWQRLRRIAAGLEQAPAKT